MAIFKSLISSATILPLLVQPRMHNLDYLSKMLESQIKNSTHPPETLVEMTEMYGCHCTSDRSVVSTGPVMDGYDDLCKGLAMCHQCILFDFPTYRYKPVSTPYDWSLNNDQEIICSDTLESAEHHSCMCDSHYAMNLGKLWSDATFNFTLWNSKKKYRLGIEFENEKVEASSFDKENVCVEHKIENDGEENYDYDDSLDCLSVFTSFMKL